MIRSIAYELFDRLTTDPDALRKQLANARADRDAVAIELADYQTGLRSFEGERLTSLQRELSAAQARVITTEAERDALQLQVSELKLQRASSPTAVEHTKQAAELAVAQLEIVRLQGELLQCNEYNSELFSEKCKAETAANLEIARLSKAYANFAGTELTIEPTWILALWSIHAEGWTEDKRGSYDSMLGEMRRTAMPWQLFPRSQWDALVKNGRAR